MKLLLWIGKLLDHAMRECPGTSHPVSPVPPIISWTEFGFPVVRRLKTARMRRCVVDTAALSVVYDSIAPVASVSIPSVLVADVETVVVKVAWSEAVSGFGAAGMAGTNLTFAEPVAASPANTYTIEGTRTAGATGFSVVRESEGG